MILYWILFIAGNVAFWVGSFLDYRSSLLQVSHGLAEADIWKINRDKYGYFSAKNFWTAHVIYWAVVTAIALVLYAYTDANEKWMILFFFSLLFYFPAAFAFIWTYFNNTSKAKRSREKVQIPILERLSQITPYSYEAVNNIFAAHQAENLFWQQTTGGRTRARAFPWLYYDGGAGEPFQERFYKAIWEISQKGRASWFADTRMKSL